MIQTNLNYIYVSCSYIALIDVLCAFAFYSINSRVITKPIIENIINSSYESKSCIIGKSCFHPVLEKNKSKSNLSLNDENKFIPNDYFISNIFNFIVIRGANASGKTTYMKQLGLLLILSQCGCFVPCEFFKFSIRKYLYTKFDSNDSLEDNRGSFIKSILEIQKAITNNISYPLILLDEPFDNSENLDNLCITLSIIDKINLIQNTPFIIMSSHNSNMNILSSLYYNIIVGNMEVEYKQDSMNFLYKFDFLNPLDNIEKNNEEDEDNLSKDLNSENYGIILANMLGYPKEIIDVLI